jgi:hypothetical protein
VLIRRRPVEDLDPESIRVEDEGRVVARDVAILFGREMNLIAARLTTLVRRIDLVAALDLEREMLDSYVVVVVPAAVGRSQSQVRAPPECAEIDDLLGSAVGGIAGELAPSERSQQGEVELQRSRDIGDREVDVMDAFRRDGSS